MAVSTAPAVQIPNACSPAAAQRSKAMRSASPAAAGVELRGERVEAVVRARGRRRGQAGVVAGRAGRDRRGARGRPGARGDVAQRVVGRLVGVRRAGVAVVDAQHGDREVVDLRGLRGARDARSARAASARATTVACASPSREAPARARPAPALGGHATPTCDVAKARGRGAVGDRHDLARLALAAVGQAPQPPLAGAGRPRPARPRTAASRRRRSRCGTAARARRRGSRGTTSVANWNCRRRSSIDHERLRLQVQARRRCRR